MTGANASPATENASGRLVTADGRMGAVLAAPRSRPDCPRATGAGNAAGRERRHGEKGEKRMVDPDRHVTSTPAEDPRAHEPYITAPESDDAWPPFTGPLSRLPTDRREI